MRRRLSLFVLLAASCVFLASLYLTWVASAGPNATLNNSPQGLLNLFSGGISYNGWGAYGQVAALLALALVAGVGASLLRSQLVTRLPWSSCGLALLYLALLNAAELHGVGVFRGAFAHHRVHLGAGAYVGLASASVAFLAAVAARRDVLTRRPTVPTAVAFALTICLLTAFILPWLHVRVPRVGRGAAIAYQLSSLGHTQVVFIALLGCFGLPLWRRRTPPGGCLAAALGLAVLVAGVLSTLGTHVHWPYEAWLQLGCALGLVALALATERGQRLSMPPVADVAAVVAGSLLIASMFLPWQKTCAGESCLSQSGWTLTGSATAGGLAVVLLVLLLGLRGLFVELAVGAAVYVMVTGLEVTQLRLTHLGYGAPLGFAGAALLLVAAARRLRVRREPRRLLTRLVPIAACLGFLAIPVLTLTGRLSPQLEIESPWRLYWVEVAAVLLAIRLLGRWLGGPKDDVELVLLPLALLAVTALDLIDIRTEGISWQGWASVVLCAILVAFGWIERNGGLERLRVPDEVWRVDRLPGEN